MEKKFRAIARAALNFRETAFDEELIAAEFHRCLKVIEETSVQQ